MTLLLLAALAGAGATTPSVDAFLAELQRAAQRDDRRAVAAMVRYPLTVTAVDLPGRPIPVPTRALFIKYYDAFFTEELKDLIDVAAGQPHAWRPSEVLMIGDNAMRIMWMRDRFQIIGLRIPKATRRVRGARRAPQRLDMAGRSVAYGAGSLAVGERETYLVRADRNALLEVHVDEVRRRDVVAQVFAASTGAPLDDRARGGARAWAGRVPAAGDYRIDVVREARDGDPILTYKLTVTVR